MIGIRLGRPDPQSSVPAGTRRWRPVELACADQAGGCYGFKKARVGIARNWPSFLSHVETNTPFRRGAWRDYFPMADWTSNARAGIVAPVSANGLLYPRPKKMRGKPP